MVLLLHLLVGDLLQLLEMACSSIIWLLNILMLLVYLLMLNKLRLLHLLMLLWMMIACNLSTHLRSLSVSCKLLLTLLQIIIKKLLI